jgi:2'-5' RNA ligase
MIKSVCFLQDGKQMTFSDITFRTFIAASIPDDIRDLAAETAENLLESTKGLKLVKPSNMHLTLAFIGDISPDIMETAYQPLSMLAESLTPFRVSFDRIATFPSVIFIKPSDGSQTLVDLASAVRTILRKNNIPYDTKPFKGHLTVARTKDRSLKAQAFLKNYAMDTRFNIEFVLNNFSVIQSDLTREGPIYTTLREYNLG